MKETVKISILVILLTSCNTSTNRENESTQLVPLVGSTDSAVISNTHIDTVVKNFDSVIAFSDGINFGMSLSNWNKCLAINANTYSKLYLLYWGRRWKPRRNV